MANFTAKDVKELRDRTGVGMMDSKKALVEAEGDIERAIELLREKGLAAAAKKAGRIAAEGIVATLVDGNTGVIVEVNAETDFVAKNVDFVKFVNDIAATIKNENPADVDALKALTLDGSDATVEAALQDKILVIGENMNIRRFERKEGVMVSYNHGGGRIGVMVEFEADPSVAANEAFQTMGQDVAMQIAAIVPRYVSREEVPAEEVAAEKEILTAQAQNEGKPEKIIAMMVEGRIGKFFEQICLLEQPFIKDGDITVGEYVEKTAKELGTAIKVKSFLRYEVGEGIERNDADFADEVASMLG